MTEMRVTSSTYNSQAARCSLSSSDQEPSILPITGMPNSTLRVLSFTISYSPASKHRSTNTERDHDTLLTPLEQV